MVINPRLILAAFASALLVTGCCSTPRGVAWDYKVVRSYDESMHSSLEKELRALGAEGWSVVSSSWVADPPQHMLVILKKPRHE
jgi:hypothetical protein